MPDNDVVTLGESGLTVSLSLFGDDRTGWGWYLRTETDSSTWPRCEPTPLPTEADALSAARAALAKIVAQVRGVTEEEKAALMTGAAFLSDHSETLRMLNLDDPQFAEWVKILKRLAGVGEVSEQ